MHIQYMANMAMSFNSQEPLPGVMKTTILVRPFLVIITIHTLSLSYQCPGLEKRIIKVHMAYMTTP